MNDSDLFPRAERVLYRTFFLLLSLLIVAGILAPTAQAAPPPLFVKPVATGSGDCSSWANACTLQTALSTAPTTGQIVWVKAGTYKPGSLDTSSFHLNGVSIFGGFDGTEAWPDDSAKRNWTVNVTTLSGDLGSGVRANNIVTASQPSTSVPRLDGFVIRDGGNSGAAGGGVYISGSLRIYNSIIRDNEGAYGGGVFQEGSTGLLTLSNTDFLSNTATLIGGGVYARGNVSLSTGDFISNTAGLHGGALHVDVGRADLNGANFEHNHANTNNGGAVNINNSIAITNTTFYSNTAGGRGGGLNQWNSGQQVSLVGTTFQNNTAHGRGGGVVVSSTLTISNSTFVSNTVNSTASDADPGGGGVYAGDLLTANGTTFTGNEVNCTACSGKGGGLRAGHASIQDSTFDGNSATFGGGLVVATSLGITRSTLLNNLAVTGGGMDVNDATGDNLLLQGNIAGSNGGAVNGWKMAFTNSRFIENTASSHGGAMYIRGHFDGTNLLFANNDSPEGGAIHTFSFEGNLTHATIAHYPAVSGAAIHTSSGSVLDVSNSIVSGYSQGFSMFGSESNSATLNADYDIIFATTQVTNTGNTTVNLGSHILNSDPHFVNPAAGDFHLALGSPAIGYGTNLGVATDLDGRPRSLSRVDLGAYVFQGRAFLPFIRR